MFKKHLILLMLFGAIAPVAQSQQTVEKFSYKSEFIKAEGWNVSIHPIEFKLEVLELAPFKFEFRVYLQFPNGPGSSLGSLMGCYLIFFPEEKEQEWVPIENGDYSVVHELNPQNLKNMKVEVVVMFGKQGSPVVTFSPFTEYSPTVND